MELVNSVVISEKLPILLSGYLVSKGRLVYNEKWDKIVELPSELEEENDNL